MAVKPVDLDTLHFAKAGDATKFFQAMLYRYRPSDTVSVDDSVALRELIKFHSEATEKIGVGIDHFEVMAAQYGTQCFKIVRVDGTEDDFSFKNCIQGAANSLAV